MIVTVIMIPSQSSKLSVHACVYTNAVDSYEMHIAVLTLPTSFKPTCSCLDTLITFVRALATFELQLHNHACFFN